jgi:hypothetical protein
MTVIGAIAGWLYIVIVAAVAVSAILLVRIPGVARANRRLAPHLYKGLYGPKGELRDTEDKESGRN